MSRNPEGAAFLGGERIQAFPVTSAALCGITTGGTKTGVALIECVEMGTFTATLSDGTITYTNVDPGFCRSFPAGASISVSSGKFDVA